MAGRVLEVVGLAIVTMCALCSAQTPATVRPAMPNCPPAPISLSPCIGYVFGVGSATLSACCAQFQAFFQAQGPCLCAAAKLAPSPFGLVLGQAQAMIPNVCNRVWCHRCRRCKHCAGRLDAIGGKHHVPSYSIGSDCPVGSDNGTSNDSGSYSRHACNHTVERAG